MHADADLHTITIAGGECLLTWAAGTRTHLTREASPGEERLSANPHDLRKLRGSYDAEALAAPRWAATTLCGRPWSRMADGDEASPTCRRCLSIIDKQFPQPALDPRFALVVQLLADTIVDLGLAEILHVPGDQQAAMRKEVRAAVHERTGFGLTTYVRESAVSFTCEPVYASHARENSIRVAEAMQRALDGGPPLETPWRLDWDTWSV